MGDQSKIESCMYCEMNFGTCTILKCKLCLENCSSREVDSTGICQKCEAIAIWGAKNGFEFFDALLIHSGISFHAFMIASMQLGVETLPSTLTKEKLYV